MYQRFGRNRFIRMVNLFDKLVWHKLPQPGDLLCAMESRFNLQFWIYFRNILQFCKMPIVLDTCSHWYKTSKTNKEVFKKPNVLSFQYETRKATSFKSLRINHREINQAERKFAKTDLKQKKEHHQILHFRNSLGTKFQL